MPQRTAVPTDNPGEYFIPELGRTLLMPFTFAWTLDKTGRLSPDDRHPSFEARNDECLIQYIGAKPGPNWQVWSDEQQEKGNGTGSQLVLRIHARDLVRRDLASLALIHLDYFWPQLHQLAVELRWGRRETIDILGPPGTLVVVSGIWKRALR